MNPKVDEYIQKSPKWQEELVRLREIMLGCRLNEEFKWDSPCYSYNGANIIGMRGFKEHCAIWFFKGALLNDSHQILTRSGESTQSMRQIKFFTLRDITNLEQQLKEYIFEAIEIEKAGVKFQFKKNTDLILSEEFELKLASIPELKKAFYSLTPGKQREYGRYFTEPKQAKTRESRIEKSIAQILNGKGLNDKYIG